MTTALSPTTRTRLGRNRDRAGTDRGALYDVLDSGLIAHLGIVLDESPRVLPTAYAYDPDGPDRDGSLYFHGSVAARSLVAAPSTTVCMTITVVDGLVLARSAFHHSMNYRSAVVIGHPRQVDDPEERDHALESIVERFAPGRNATLRANTRKELAATTVLALPLHEASVKARDGDPVDDAPDIEAGDTWAGVVPLHTGYGEPIRGADCDSALEVPAHVRALVDGANADHT